MTSKITNPLFSGSFADAAHAQGERLEAAIWGVIGLRNYLSSFGGHVGRETRGVWSGW
jgi:hypothetical protein